MLKNLFIILCLSSPVFVHAQSSEDVVRNLEIFLIGAVYDFDEEDDPNKQLGRPNQYIQKTSWADRRIDPHDFSESNEEEINNLDPTEYKGGTIEKFKSQVDLNRRYEYIKNITLDLPTLNQYMYKKGLFLMRLDKTFKPNQAKEYERQFYKVVK